MSGVRAVLRIARRDATHAKGRSALVLAMIGLPVMAITALAVLMSTITATPVEGLPRRLGTADAKVSAHGRGPVLQDPLREGVVVDNGGSGGSGSDRPWRTDEVASALGPGTRERWRTAKRSSSNRPRSTARS